LLRGVLRFWGMLLSEMEKVAMGEAGSGTSRDLYGGIGRLARLDFDLGFGVVVMGSLFALFVGR
jgi:hypothetical protein